MSAFTSIFSENCVCECVSVRMGVHQNYFFRFSKIYTHFLYIEVASAFSFFLDWRQIYICSNDVIFDMICFLTETSLWNCFFFRLASVLRTNRIIVSINELLRGAHRNIIVANGLGVSDDYRWILINGRPTSVCSGCRRMIDMQNRV